VKEPKRLEIATVKDAKELFIVDFVVGQELAESKRWPITNEQYTL